jgi:pimeloyl-ACP methyl ester carboxylesterase
MILSRLVLITLLCTLAAFAGADTFDSDGIEIYYTVQGEGTPIVLIHGFSASAATNFGASGIISGLASDYKVIALDCRGHGKSGKPHDPKQYGTQMIKDVINLLDHLKIKKAHVSGYSMGGFITTKLVTMYPERVLRAIPGGAGWSEEGTDGDNIQNELADSLESGKGIGPLIVALTPEGQEPPAEEAMKAMNTMLMASNDPLALAAVIRGMANIVVTKEDLQKNKVPALYLIGEQDPLKEGVDALDGVMSAFHVKVIPGADHMTAFSGGAYLKHMKDFLGSDEGSSEK